MSHLDSHPAVATPNGHQTPRSFYHVCHDLKKKLDDFLAEDVQDDLLKGVQIRLRESMGIVEESLSRYSSEQIAISWNGGKDCLVMLVILLASLARCIPAPEPQADQKTGTFPDKLRGVYIVSAHPFPEVDDFVELSSTQYHLDTTRIALSMKEGLGVFLKDHPQIQAVYVGTRRTDPFSENLKDFDPTDSGWPSVMRIHCILEWRLAEIWAVSYTLWPPEDPWLNHEGYDADLFLQFIRHLNLPYCSLYDQGYTSLGGKLNTVPNPRLKKEGDGFLPAYELSKDDEERLGRYG